MIDAREITEKSGPIRILAVDDNPTALYATSRVLRSAGYEVIEAATGAAALAAAAGADLIVLDVNLPDIDGFEVCRRLVPIRARHRSRCCTCRRPSPTRPITRRASKRARTATSPDRPSLRCSSLRCGRSFSRVTPISSGAVPMRG